MLQLTPFPTIERRLSASEYYHASVRKGLNNPELFSVTYVLEGDGPDFVPEVWERALQDAVTANAGSHLRLAGTSFFARWKSDGLPPRLRIIEQIDWDGMSQKGAAFIEAIPLCIRRGPTVELLLVNKSPRGKFVIIRALHGVMDGMGTQHFLADVFRALRGEPLRGTNAAFSSADLMRYISPPKPPQRSDPIIRTDRLTGSPEGTEGEEVWKRVNFSTSRRNILGRIAQILAEYLHLRSDRPAVFSIPVDLRRHYPELHTTANFFGILLIKLAKGEDSSAFRQKIEALLASKMDAFYLPGQNLIKILPRSLLSWLSWKIFLHYRKRPPLITMSISNQGRVDPSKYSCEHFHPQSLFALPFHGTNVTLSGIGERIEIIIGMPKVLSSDGRMEDLISFLLTRLTETENT